MALIRLGILDFCGTIPGVEDSSVIARAAELAQVGEQCGYSRYWIAEHHTLDAGICFPELLIAAVGACTTRLKVGAGGVMLRYRDPYLVAQAFSLLEALFPGRVELGVARGLLPPEEKHRFPEANESEAELIDKIHRLLSLFSCSPEYSVLRPRVTPPPVWLLGGASAGKFAAENGTSVAFDGFYSVCDASFKEMVATAIRSKVDIAGQNAAYAIALAGVCAKSDGAAADIVANSQFGRRCKPHLVGSEATCREQIRVLSEETGITNFILLCMSRRPTEKIEAHKRWADAILR